jgi:hypothetical protein
MFDVKKLNKIEMTILLISEKLISLNIIKTRESKFKNLFSRTGKLMFKVMDSQLMFPFILTSMYVALNKNYTYIEVELFSIAAVTIFFLSAALLVLIAEVPNVIWSYVYDLQDRQKQIETNTMMDALRSRQREFNEKIHECRRKIDEVAAKLALKGEIALSQRVSNIKERLPIIDVD